MRVELDGESIRGISAEIFRTHGVICTPGADGALRL